MNKHIKQLAKDYAKPLRDLDDDQVEVDIARDFEAGVRAVLAHPEEFGLKQKED